MRLCRMSSNQQKDVARYQPATSSTHLQPSWRLIANISLATAITSVGSVLLNYRSISMILMRAYQSMRTVRSWWLNPGDDGYRLVVANNPSSLKWWLAFYQSYLSTTNMSAALVPLGVLSQLIEAAYPQQQLKLLNSRKSGWSIASWRVQLPNIAIV